MPVWLRWLLVALVGVALSRLLVDLVRIGSCPECRGALLLNPARELYCGSCGYLAPSERAGRLARWRLEQRCRRQERAAAAPADVVRAGAEQPDPVGGRELAPV